MSSDMKNLFLAGFCNTPAFLMAADTKTLITIISAIVLPILFFAIGKTVDVLLQIHFKRREQRRSNDEN